MTFKIESVSRRRLLLASLPLAALVGGCATSVRILAPSGGIQTQPVTQFVALLEPRADSATFRAELNNQDVTSQFVWSAFRPGPGLPPNEKVLHITDDTFFYQHTIQLNGFPSNQFVLHVGAGFRLGSSGKTYDEVKFYAPLLVILRYPSTTDQNLSLRQGETITADVLAPAPLSAPLVVRVVEMNGARVSLNGLPPGQSILLTLPPSTRQATFTIRGVVAGNNYGLQAFKVGYWCAGAVGFVSRPP